ncbi:hypothetical protein EXN66_Car003082 [Channa argus]|uniref:Uncharacterized protein n=1 Tax=Channa argus TaxID=215402 RepID=A0A6G1PAT5_CHAAH|nr:hypothetical protein EXN66_Car003082 [Channa argus]
MGQGEEDICCWWHQGSAAAAATTALTSQSGPTHTAQYQDEAAAGMEVQLREKGKSRKYTGLTDTADTSMPMPSWATGDCCSLAEAVRQGQGSILHSPRLQDWLVKGHIINDIVANCQALMINTGIHLFQVNQQSLTQL